DRQSVCYERQRDAAPGARCGMDVSCATYIRHWERAFTVGLTVGHNAAYPVETECQTLLDGHGGLRAATGIAIANAHAEREPVTAHAETQKHLFEIITPIFAVPISWTRRARFCTRAGLLLIGPIQRNGSRILMEPGCRNG